MKKARSFYLQAFQFSRLNRRKPILHSSLFTLNLKRSVTHTAGRCDGRQKGRESGYYDLHRNLNKTLLHNLLTFLPLTSHLL